MDTLWLHVDAVSLINSIILIKAVKIKYNYFATLLITVFCEESVSAERICPV